MEVLIVRVYYYFLVLPALSVFVQASMIQAIERYMKQAIVDRNSAVSSAALISSFVSLFIIHYTGFHGGGAGGAENWVEISRVGYI